METNIIDKTAALRPILASLKVGEWVDLPKELHTAAAARKAVQRINQKEGALATAYPYLGIKITEFKVSETAYPGGTRVTRIQ